MRDRATVLKDHLQETAYHESNGHVTGKGQGRDPKIFEARYLNNRAR